MTSHWHRSHIRNTFLVSLLAYGGFVFASGPAQANLSSMATGTCDLADSSLATDPCAAVSGIGIDGAIGTGAGAPGSSYIGARSTKMSLSDTPIYSAGRDGLNCYYIDNQSGDSLFLPFRTAEEWTGLLKNLPTGVVVKNCAIAGNVSVPPNYGTSTACVTASPTSQTVYVPYYTLAPSYLPATKANGSAFKSQYTSSVNFSCASADGTAFTETAVATFAPQSSVNPITDPTTQVGWKVSNVTYAYNGVCGAAAGTTSGTSPASNLCHVGTVTGPTLNSEANKWTWTCSGGNGGGTTATCAATQFAPTNGACGGANGVTVSTAPTNNLCSAGTATGVYNTGSSSYAWSCAGLYGGTTAYCAAPIAADCTLTQCSLYKMNGSGCAPGYSYEITIPNGGTYDLYTEIMCDCGYEIVYRCNNGTLSSVTYGPPGQGCGGCN